MPSATVVYLAPAARGTGDGSSAANAHKFAVTADATWLNGILTTWNTELAASSTDVGINDATTFRTVQPGFESGYGDKSYVPDVRTAVYVRRVCFLTDVGTYTLTGMGNSPFCELSLCVPMPTDPLTAGTSGQPAIRLLHVVGYRTSDGKMTHQVSTTTTSRTQAIPTKGGTSSTWTNAANYVGKGPAGANQMTNWNGSSSNVNYTWSVADPAPVRAVFTGNRTPDPRTQTEINNKVQWNVGVAVTVYDPTLSGVEPKMLDGSGNAITLNPGQKIDPATKTITTVTSSFTPGGYVFGLSSGISSVVFQGMECHDFQGAFTYGGAGTLESHFQGFRDMDAYNTKYFIWRGNYHYDVEFTRVRCTGVSQKHFNPGKYCQRWSLQDIQTLGNWVVGDQYPALIGAADGNTGSENAYGSGCFRWENIIIENLWTGTPSGVTYVNGDGIDMEIQGVAVVNYYADLTPDGAIDNKTRPYWVNWVSILIVNGFFRRNKRCFRSWGPSGYPDRSAPHVMRNVTIAGARQYGVFMRSADAAHHKYVNWYNADGRCNFMDYSGESYIAVSNDNNIDGNQDCVIHQCYDARSSTATVSSFLNANTALGDGGATPFRCRLWTPVTVPATLTLAVNGSTTDDGTSLTVQAGSSVTVHPSGMPTGTAYTYTIAGPATTTRSGDDATITVTLT